MAPWMEVNLGPRAHGGKVSLPQKRHIELNFLLNSIGVKYPRPVSPKLNGTDFEAGGRFSYLRDETHATDVALELGLVTG